MARETELYKDKIEVSLDGRQIFYLFFGGAVIVGLVFVLGVMVGRRVEARGHVERAQTASGVDPLAALDRLEGGGGLSFQGALRGTEPPVSDIDKTIGEIAKARAATPEVKKPDAKKPEPAVENKPEPAVENKPEHRTPIEPKAKAAVDKKPEPGMLEPKYADKKPQAEKKPEPAGDKKQDPEKKPRFTLQLSSFKDRSDAEAFQGTMKLAGYTAAYITEGEVDGKTFYRVRLGGYRSIEAANDAKTELEKATAKSATVMKL